MYLKKITLTFLLKMMINQKILFVIMSVFLFSTNVSAQKAEEDKEKIGRYLYDSDSIVYLNDSTDVYVVENLGENVNSAHVESGPRITPDGKSLYFFRVDHPENISGTRDIWVSHWDDEDSIWLPAEHLGDPLNNHGPNSVHWISPDGDQMLVHGKYLKNGVLDNGVSMTHKQRDGTWSFPEELKIKKFKNDMVSSFYMNNDATVLILAIHYDDKSSYGEQDLYVSFKDGKKWTQPKNMGPVINTAGSEATAFLADDNITMYYSTNGRKDTIGGFDIYKTVRQDSTWTNWSEPENIGPPYNTPDDEFYFSFDKEGEYAYLSHHYIGPKDSLDHSDIVRIKMRPTPELELSGLVTDEFSDEPTDAKITFTRVSDGEVVEEIVIDSSNADSGYATKLPMGHVYEYTVESEGHQTITKQIDLSKLKKSEKREMNIAMKRDPALVLEGYVMDEETNEPLDSAMVKFVRKSDGKVMGTFVVTPDDPYHISLPAGEEYEVKISEDSCCLSETEKIDLTKMDKYKEESRDFSLKRKQVGVTFEIDNIYFETAKAKLKPESFEALDKLVDKMKDAGKIKVEISGHTDWVGTKEYNYGLSERRAQSVVDYLVENGIDKDNLVAKGYGEDKPVATNETPEGRAKNRRVEFEILEIK